MTARGRRRSAVTVALVLLTGLAFVVTAAAAWWPPTGASVGVGAQTTALLRLAGSLLVVLVLLLAPGLALRGLRRPEDPMALGLVPLPGAAGLLLLGLVVWVRPLGLGPITWSVAGLELLLVATVALLLVRGARLLPGEGWTLTLTALALLAAVGRSLWSQGPDGELYGGSESRTLEVGDRPDSRISFHVLQVVSAGVSPYAPRGAALFAPYSFTDRGPVLGLVATPVTLATGGRPSLALPDGPWSLLDHDGFMVYRIVAMALAVLVVPVAFSLARQVAGPAAGVLAAAATATTPFVVHETYFTWPKLLTAAVVGLAALQVLRRRRLYAGLLMVLAFLCHPLALLAIPTVLALALVVAWRGHGDLRSRLLSWLAWIPLLVVLPALALVAWARSSPLPSHADFVGYVVQADAVPVHSLGAWVGGRLESLGNTLVPLRLPWVDGDLPWVNKLGGGSDGVVHFFFQYWTGVPFGLAIVFLPVLLWGLWLATRRWPWAVLLLVVAPFLLFWVYWGSYQSGLMREGLHPWVLGLLVVWALAMAPLTARTGWAGRLVRLALALRCVEIVAMMVVPTLDGPGSVLGAGHRAGDLVAWTLMVGASLALGVVAFWSTRPALGSAHA